MAELSREFKGLISELFYAAQEIPSLAQLLIYGSVARGEEERSSDVDVLLVFDVGEDPEKTGLARIGREKIGRAFADAGCERGAQVAATNLRGMDESFLENVAREGVVVWGRPFFIGAGEILRPMTLFEYRVGGRSRVEKVRFYRALKSLESVRVKNGLLVSEENVESAESIFKINNIEHTKTKIWLS